MTIVIFADGAEARDVDIEYDVKPDSNIDILTCDGCVLDRAAQRELDRLKADRDFWKQECVYLLRGSKVG